MQQRGFTLIEMMIALLLGSIAAISLTMITRSMAQTAENEQMVVEASQAARAGIDMLRFDFMRAGMFYAANPRSGANSNSLVSDGGAGSGTHMAYFRNPIVHLNPNATGPDTVILVGNFIGDTMYEGEVDANGTILMHGWFPQGQCAREFDGNYAFAHLVLATGQTHEVKVSASATPVENGCSNGVCQTCQITAVGGELIGNAFGERNVKVGANQAVMFRVENLTGNRNVLMRYFIDYDTNTSATIGTGAENAISAVSARDAVVVAENVVDFQVWFRAVDPNSTGNGTQPVADQAYYPALTGASITTLPPETAVLVNQTSAVDQLPLPTRTNIDSNVVFPEYVRSAIISLAVRTERTDQSQGTGSSAGQVLTEELASAPVDSGGNPVDVGNYKVRRYTVEVKLPNIQSQMYLFNSKDQAWSWTY
jgi:prepilin-type N-terminal cleavage/methylation domain-containing protein